MTPDQLRAAGEALYGARWQSPLAAALGVNGRTMRRWLAGRFKMPDDLGFRVQVVASERAIGAQLAEDAVAAIISAPDQSTTER